MHDGPDLAPLVLSFEQIFFVWHLYEQQKNAMSIVCHVLYVIILFMWGLICVSELVI